MYCNKLINITDNGHDHQIDYGVIRKFDKFIKEKTTLRERERLNPYKFSIEMGVKQEVSVMTFILGARLKLFETRIYYRCYCEEQLEIFNLYQPLDCTCGKTYIPSKDRSNVYLYFQLLETPAPCSWNEKAPEFPLDFLESEGYGDKNFTLAELDQIAGQEVGDSLVSLRKSRDDKFNDFLEEFGCDPT